MTLEAIGRLLHEQRRMAGKKLKDIKLLTAMNPSNVSRIERGVKPLVQFATLVRLCEVYGFELVVQKKAVTDE